MNTLNILGSVASIVSLAMAVYFEVASDAAAKRNAALIVATAFLLAVLVRVFRHRPVTLQDETEIAVAVNRSYEYFYPHSFRRPPNLKVKTVHGGADIEIVEQRVDGFRIKTIGSSAWGSPKLVIRWVARGEPA